MRLLWFSWSGCSLDSPWPVQILGFTTIWLGSRSSFRTAAAAVRAEREAEERRPTPKLKKYYKDQKAKEKKA